ncbi:MAG: sigma-70 family RNA polymerase sigma factor [Pirellulaceae bacterium]
MAFRPQDHSAPSPNTAFELEALVSQYSRAVYAYGFRLSGNAVDAEDLTQQTFLLAQQKLHQLRDTSRARSWLLAIVRNCFLQELKKRRVSLESDSDLQMEDDIPDPVASAEIDQEQIHQCIAELAPAFRIVLLMYYFEQASYKEIAAQLDLPVGTVMSRLARAKSQLRQKLTAANVPE